MARHAHDQQRRTRLPARLVPARLVPARPAPKPARPAPKGAPVRSAAVLAVIVVVVLSGWLHSSGRWPFAVDAGAPPSLTTLPPGVGKPIVEVGPGTALALLDTLLVKGKSSGSDYERSAFGEAWADADGNGCDTRNDVLRRDLQNLAFAQDSWCVVASGLLAEPYTGKDIEFQRGKDSSAAVQIDHLVALGNAWRTGAAALTPEQRESLANDPLNLMAVDGPANEEKSDGDAATWLPAAKKIRCHYVARQISVKAAYTLWVAPAEKAAMVRVLGLCPQQESLPSGYLP